MKKIASAIGIVLLVCGILFATFAFQNEASWVVDELLIIAGFTLGLSVFAAAVKWL